MAEILGAIASSITLASLVKLCLEAFEIIQTTKKQGLDSTKLILRLNIERARLYTWGQAMGLTRHNPDESTSLLMDSPFRSLITETLEMIIAIFQDGDKLSKTYGCCTVNESHKDLIEAGNNSAVENLAKSFASFKIFDGQQTKIRSISSKTKWAIKDRKKFSTRPLGNRGSRHDREAVGRLIKGPT